MLRYCFASGHQQKKLLRFCRSCTRHCPIGRTAGLCVETIIGHKPCKAYLWWRLSYFTCCQCAPTTCLQQSCLLLLKLLQRLDLNSMTEALVRSIDALPVQLTCTGAQLHALSCAHDLPLLVGLQQSKQSIQRCHACYTVVSCIPGGSSHGLGPAVAAPRAEVVLVLAVLAPARSQGLGGRAVSHSCFSAADVSLAKAPVCCRLCEPA